MKRPIAFLVGFLAFTTAASAQYADFALTGGYSHIYPDKTGGLFFNKDGAYVDGDFAFRVPAPLPFFLGFGVTASGYWDSESFPSFINNNNGFVDTSNLYSDVELVELEPRLAVKLMIPGVPGFYIRPRIGAGLLVSDYSIDTPQTVNTITYVQTMNHTGAAFEVRPDVEAGWGYGRASFGFDLSYMAAWGAFGQMGNNIQELRAGVFARFRY